MSVKSQFSAKTLRKKVAFQIFAAARLGGEVFAICHLLIC